MLDPQRPDVTLDSAAPKPNWFSRLAHPGSFMAWSKPVLLPLGAVTVLAFAAGLWFTFFNSPADYQMGDTVRIMYIHVPNAWLSQFVYGVMFVAALGTLVWRHPLADVAQKAAAPLGAVFTALALFSGSLWGRPTWGTFWEWDGRMTSTLVLFFIYLGIIALWRAFDDQLPVARHAEQNQSVCQHRQDREAEEGAEEAPAATREAGTAKDHRGDHFEFRGHVGRRFRRARAGHGDAAGHRREQAAEAVEGDLPARHPHP